MKVLVIGGTRFLGYHLVRRLLELGHEVVLFNRGATPDDFGDRVERIRGDRADRAAFRRGLSGRTFDVVADMIAYEAADSRSAVEALEGRVGHFIHISSGAVYVVTKDYPCPLREEDFDRPLAPGGAGGASAYGRGKRDCERVLREAHSASGFPVTIVRPPIILGERDYTLRAQSYFLRLRDGGPVVLPDAGMSVFTHAYQGDIVRTIAANIGNARTFGKAYNLAWKRALTLKGFVRAAASILAVPADIVAVPSDVLERAGWSAASSPFFNKRPFILDTRLAERDLGYDPWPPEAGLERAARWFRDEYRGGPPAEYSGRGREIEIASRYRRALGREGLE